jgi:hypothetical protein
MIKLYLTHGESVDEDGNTPRFLAMKSNYGVIFRGMLARGADAGRAAKSPARPALKLTHAGLRKSGG